MSAGRLALAVLRMLLPLAERDEVLGDLEAEYGRRRAARGAWAASRWLWAQTLLSIPALLSRSAWRGFTGFESRANAMNPGGPLMERWLHDARYAVRRLRTRPTYTALAALTLALGVGGMTAIAGIVRPILVDPLPYPADRELGILWSAGDWNAAEVLALRPEWKEFAGMAAFRPNDVTVEVPGGPTQFVPAVAVSAELFDVLGRQPLLGRGFQPGQDAPGAAGVVVLSDRFWRELGADRAIVGTTLRLGGELRTVVGVMPPGFWFPDPAVRLWLCDTLTPGEQVGQYAMIGRAKGGRDVHDVIPSLASAARILGTQFTYPPAWDKTKNPTLIPLREQLIGHMRPSLLATLAAMAVILLIACANVAALMLGQVESRSGELAVRTALGADRARLTLQLVFESVALGLLGGVAGSIFAIGGFGVLRKALPLGDWVERAQLDWSVFAVALLVAVLSSLVVALFPTISLWRGDLRVVLAGMRTAGVVRARGGLQGALVVGEVAAAVLLACGAGLLARSVSKLYAISPGVDTARIAVVDVVMPTTYDLSEKRNTLRDIVAELSTMPGVELAASTQKLPLRGGGDTGGLVVPGADPGARPTANFRVVTPEYFRVMGIPLLQGKTLSAVPPGGTATPTEREVVINETLAKTFFPDREPLGQVIRGMGAADRVVGVVGDVAEQALTQKRPPARYYVTDQVDFFLDGQTLVLRTAPSVEPSSLLPEVRRVIARTRPDVAVRETTTMKRVFDRAVGPARDVMTLLALLTGLGLVLGAVGVYGVTAQFVARRARDWSIRTALGLGPWQLVTQILGHGVYLIGIGVVAGVAGALAFTRLLASFLYGVGATDPIALGGAALVLLSVGVLATFIPAWRASRVNPALVLRAE